MSDWEFPKAPGDQKNNWERFSTLLYFPKRGAISAVLSPVHLEVCSSYQVVNYIVFTDCAIVLNNQWLVYINCWRDGGHGYHYPDIVCLQGSSLGKGFILYYLRGQPQNGLQCPIWASQHNKPTDPLRKVRALKAVSGFWERLTWPAYSCMDLKVILSLSKWGRKTYPNGRTFFSIIKGALGSISTIKMWNENIYSFISSVITQENLD